MTDPIGQVTTATSYWGGSFFSNTAFLARRWLTDQLVTRRRHQRLGM
jgi:hypothetical protein